MMAGAPHTRFLDPEVVARLGTLELKARTIVEGFLSFSRGLDDLKVTPTKPYEIARELGVLLETRAEEAGVTIEAGGDEALVLDADPRKLRQALLNIVLNAIQEGRARGLGQMPAQLYQGREAEEVAEFVAAVAGH